MASIGHEDVTVLVPVITADSIKFPDGHQLLQTMSEFELLAQLPMCCGAVDGTFVKIVKPEEFGDSYWCYKFQLEEPRRTPAGVL